MRAKHRDSSSSYMSLLPHLVEVLRESRVAAQMTFGQVAVWVRKRDGRVGVSDSTIIRFEQGTHWPLDPDAVVDAYSKACDVPARDLWQRAVERWRD